MILTALVIIILFLVFPEFVVNVICAIGAGIVVVGGFSLVMGLIGLLWLMTNAP